MYVCFIFFFKQKTAYEMRISDWSSDVCSSDLITSGASAGIAGAAFAATLSFVDADGASADPHAASGWQSIIAEPYIRTARHPAVLISKGPLLARRPATIAGSGARRPSCEDLTTNVRTPVNKPHLVCRLLLENQIH